MRTIQLLTKAGLLIDTLADGPSTHAELAKQIDEPRSSIYRLTSSLEEAGFVHITSDGLLSLGVSILHLGDSAVDALVNRSLLREHLTWIRDQLGMTAYFCSTNSEQIMCLDKQEGADIDLMYLAPGQILPHDRGAIAHAINGDRQVGIDHEELATGVSSIAVPVITAQGELVGAVAVAGLRTHIESAIDTIRETLTTSARTISNFPPISAMPAPPLREEEKTTSVITKAAMVLRVIRAEKHVTSSRIAEVLGEPISSVYRMLHTLTTIGWVEQDGKRGAYQVGLKMLTLANHQLIHMDLRTIVTPTMRNIHARTGETTFLCVRHATRAVCIDRIDGLRVNSRVLQLGTALPLHVGAAPRTLLAFEGRKAWEAYATSLGFEGHNWSQGPSRAELFDILNTDREQGFCLVDSEVTPGIAAVGAPIFNHRNEVIASLSVSGLREGILQGINGHHVVDLVVDGAREISETLGATVKPSGGRNFSPHTPAASTVV
ncbi:IclR family transcriptional regulator [Corynebacterium deserti GIMN1.010]|uniref:IclR family transcriptional regulator n=1 Tax=Corynebacterium deserti GIMN1.010 TaxID=931089 RepID=A0A0M4CP06_9CORY|nr:IclR family transcriptional regulator C-terminal domain-containing protein [Corynebacterium deserti]ALC07097.1 IclR family transcriptional regulator [Corynebacterium deserti GIMN1.010]